MKKYILAMLILLTVTDLFAQISRIKRCDAIVHFAKRFGERDTTVLGNVLALVNAGANEQDVYVAMDAFLDQYEKEVFWIRKSRQGGHNGLTAPDLISGFLTILHDQGKPDSFYDVRVFFGNRTAVALRLAPMLHNDWQQRSDKIFSDIPSLRKEMEKCQ